MSALHAEIAWDGARWTLRDLGSRNGTFLAERRVPAGTDVPLEAGQVLDFGAPTAGWRLRDAGAPHEAVAEPLDGGPDVPFRDGQLFLPDDQDPEVQISQVPPDLWRLDRGDVQAPVAHREIVIVRGRRWRLHLPARLPETLTAGAGSGIADAELRFLVSPDEETVALSVRHGAVRVELQPRAHLYLLLTLARRRIADRADGTLPETQHG